MAEPKEMPQAPGDGLASTLDAGRGPPPTSFPVTDWDRYEFVRPLGVGGMGAVYEARDRRLGRLVALKFIRGTDPRLGRRLAQEARAQARIEHPNVCKVFEVGEVEGHAYIAMQLVHGFALGSPAEHLSLHDKVRIVRDAALALHEAHKLGVLHRDVKPANILVETGEDGRLRPIVMDFGLAREEGGEHGLTQTGVVMGTPAYMSPEQARGSGRGLDRRADVYSLGATLYDLLAGRPPFQGDSVLGVVFAVLHEEPVPLRSHSPQVPRDLETIVAKCLRKEPGDRYDSAKALADDLDRYIAGEPILGRPESIARRLRRRAAKHRPLVAMAALAIAAAIVAGALALRARSLARKHAADLEAEARTARELGQDVKEMEWFLHAAHLLPLHDVTRERALVRERMSAIAARAADSGRDAALVDYALGRGHLALREDALARERLARAQQAGLDTPELHYALGLVLGRLYEREMNEARLGGAPSWVERQTEELEARYLRPALSEMDRSRGLRLEAPSYLDGLVAFYRKDYDGALGLARRAQSEAPWLYEGLELEADIHLTRGVERKGHGEPEGAEQDLEAAARLFDRAAEIGRSDAVLYEGAAEARIRKLEMRAVELRRADDDYAIAVDRCEKAALAQSDRSEPYTEIAYAHQFQFALARDGDEAHRLADRQLEAATRALEIRGGHGDFATYERLAAAHHSAAQYDFAHDLDPAPSITESIEAARLAIEVSPRHPWGYTALGASYFYRGIFAVETGEDPTADLGAAVEHFGESIDSDPGYVAGWSNILEADVHVAFWLEAQGRDPASATRGVEDAFAGCLRANARYMQCFQNAGGVDAAYGAYAVLAGADATAALDRAQARLEQASTMANNLENRQRLARVHLLRAHDVRRRGRDPQPALAAMRAVLDDCYQLAPTDALCTLLDARRELLACDARAGAGGRPEGACLERARTLAALATARDERETEGYEVLAEAELRLASLGGPAGEAAAHATAGLAACARGLARNPNLARLHATRGRLLLVQARATSGEARAALERAAAEALRRAFEINPLLPR